MLFILFSIGILSLLILISGAFSAAEIALSSANRTKLKMLAESGDKKAKQLLAALEDPTSFFATTQLYITFIAFFAGAYAADSFTDPLVNWALGQGLPVSEAIAEPVVFLVVTIILTYFMLVFGELVPKHIALQNAITFSFATIGLLNVLSKIVLPFVKFLSFSANFLLKLMGVKNNGHEEEITKEEIRMMLKSGNEHGNIAEGEHHLLNKVLELDDKTVKDASIHRIDVVALPLEVDFTEIVDVLIKEKYSRLPIYEESIDNIVGILHMKDIMKYMVEHPDTSKFNIKTLLREPYFLPSFKKADEAFNEMQKARVYMAVVIDEYGGMMGIVTMEDLVEEIVGNILDEYDTDEPSDITSIDDKAFIIQGTTDFEKIEYLFNADLPVDEYDTLSGFLIGQLGGIPLEGEKPELEYNGLLFKIESVKEKRITTVLVSKVLKEETEDVTDE